MQFAYIGVEGQHDIAFVGRLLSELGLRSVRLKEDVNVYWHDLIPSEFPPDGDLLIRIHVPFFFQNDAYSVAVYGEAGMSRLVESVRETLFKLQSMPAAIGLLLDADNDTPEQRFATIREGLHRDSGLDVPEHPGEVSSGSPRVGVYVLPDNQQHGTLEDILLQCGEVSYPALFANAMKYVQDIDLTDLVAKDREEFNKPAGRKKATIASVASILRPGMSIAVSIRQNRWVRGDALNLPCVASIHRFIKDLLAIE